MNFEELKHSIVEITKLNFTQRDLELQKAVTKIVQEMNARGVLHSTMTLHKMAEFFGEESNCRCVYIKDLLLNSIPNLNYKEIDDPVGKTKTLYQEISISEKTKIISHYNQRSKNICDSLLSKNMIKQIEDMMNAAIESSLRENNEILHFECSSLFNKNGNRALAVPESVKFVIDVFSLCRKIFT